MATPILTAAQMRACDEYTIRELGIPSQVLMERAARAVARYLLDHPADFPDGAVLVLCGNGNNGGDGFAAARFLADGSMGERRTVTIGYVGPLTEAGSLDENKMSVECARQYRLAREADIAVVTGDAILTRLSEASAIVDAIFGIGISRPVEGFVARLLCEAARSAIPVLAVDIPSGLCADTGAVMGTVLPASATVTMQALKAGLLLGEGANACGCITVCNIGIDLSPAPAPYATLADETALRLALPPRRRRSHKGTYGRILCVCGSAGMSGAAHLAASAALRAGTGLVEILTSADNRIILQTALPEAIVTAYDSNRPSLASIVNAVTRADGLTVGCGLGTSPASLDVLSTVLEHVPADGSIPVVLDADALNLLARHPDLWDTPLLSSSQKQVILTPHPAEMARLCRTTVADILHDPAAAARTLAQTRGVTVILKDAHTVIASPDDRLSICAAGNAGMATGGSGDVLAGIAGAIVTQRRADLHAALLSLHDVAAAAVYLHAAAGDAAADTQGECSLTASDIVVRIATVTQNLSDTKTPISHL
jgi:NAD(P)H-hydrate epimerase